MPRPKKKRQVESIPQAIYFKPQGVALTDLKEVVLTIGELEALRLVDGDGLNQVEAAEKMKISQPTLARILASARQKTADGLARGKAIKIKGGDYQVTSKFLGRGLGRGGGRGRRGGDFAAGPGGVCVCTNPDCGYEVAHSAGVPCYQMKCPQCGSPMIRKR